MISTFRTALISFASFCLIGCSAPDYSAEIDEINSLFERVREADKTFSQIPIDSALVLEKLVDRDLKLVSNRFSGDISIETAEKIQGYRGVMSVVKKTKPIVANVKVELPAVINQLEMLRKALEVGATRDRDNRKINRDYVKNALASERAASEVVIAQVEDVRVRMERALTDYSVFQPQLAAFLDSLRNLNP